VSILIAAGGTAGHIVPALAVAEKLRELSPSTEIIFCGVGKEIERKLIPKAGFELLEISFPPFRGKGIAGILSFLNAVPTGISRARKTLRSRGVTAVIGFGGYPSFAPMMAAWLLRIPRVLHEQNVQVGLANKLLEKISTRVFAVTGARGFSAADKVRFLPLPVRDSFRKIPALEAKPEITVLILGGSQGAVTVNTAALSLVPLFRENSVSVIHQTGTVDYERVRDGYASGSFAAAEVSPFIDDVADALERAHLVISRAGAMSVAEISAAGRAGVFVPLAIAGAHQKANIEELLERDAAVFVEQNEHLATNLKAAVESLLKQPSKIVELGARARQVSLTHGEASEEIIAQAVLSARSA